MLHLSSRIGNVILSTDVSFEANIKVVKQKFMIGMNVECSRLRCKNPLFQGKRIKDHIFFPRTWRHFLRQILGSYLFQFGGPFASHRAWGDYSKQTAFALKFEQFSFMSTFPNSGILKKRLCCFVFAHNNEVMLTPNRRAI